MKKRSSSEEYQPDALIRKVLNIDLAFNWIEGGSRFWFKRQTRDGEELVVVNARTGEQSLSTEIAADLDRAHDGSVSPDGQYAIVRKGNDLSLRVLASGEERRLTHDGEPDFAYGVDEINPYFDQRNVARRRAGDLERVSGVIWSPDNRYVVVMRRDFRSVPARLFVTEYVPPDDTYVPSHFRRIPLACDLTYPDSELVLIDIRTSKLKQVQLDPQALNDYALLYFLSGVVWWTSDRSKLHLLTFNRGGSRCGLSSIDPDNGTVREILHESARFNVRLNPFDYSRPNAHVTADGADLIWYSERSGYGHLYLHDGVTGQLKRQLTSGTWVVFDLLHVDEERRLVYFTAAARSSGGNPYYRYLYRVSLDGGDPQLLTPEIADHRFNNYFGPFRYLSGGFPQPGSRISPRGDCFIDSYSTTSQPPEYVLRRSSGELVAKLLTSDASELHAMGWRPPEQVMTLASDGVTELHGVITMPRDFDPEKKYPVIDSMYPGPQGSFAPRGLVDVLGGGPIHHLQAFADDGFIVVALDARGTAHRSRAFRDAFLGTEDVFGAADHVAAIRNLAAERPYMDLERVGVRGQSFGGYGALRAMLLYPDFFKVGVAATGPEGYLDFPAGVSTERFFGVPAASSEVRAFYDLISNTRLVSRLNGHVLLIYGGIDENVPLKHGLALLDALIKADRDFDLLLVPDSAHPVPKDPYVIRRSVQYFVEHLAPSSRGG